MLLLVSVCVLSVTNKQKRNGIQCTLRYYFDELDVADNLVLLCHIISNYKMRLTCSIIYLQYLAFLSNNKKPMMSE